MNFVWFMGKINYNMDSYHSCRGSSCKNEGERSCMRQKRRMEKNVRRLCKL